MGFELQDVINDPDLAEGFTILRNPGKPGAGGWVAGAPQQIPAWGVVSVASNKEIQMLPEADRVSEVRTFHTQTALYVTSEALGLTADILVWNGVQYRAMVVAEYPNRGGYYEAIAVRIGGN